MPSSAAHGPIEKLVTLPVTLFYTNCYVLKLASGETVVVDPGGDADRIVGAVEDMGGSLAFILCTHAHLDHIEAAGAVKARAGGTIALHRDDLPLWDNVGRQASMFMLPAPPRLPPPDVILAGGEELTAGACSIQVCHVPGHSPGSVTFLFSEAGVGFNGDTVFSMGIGRTDLWGGDSDELRRSLVEKLFKLPDSLVLYPGHGDPITVMEARRNEAMLDLL